jgi:uncharacterized protein (TIGR03437 family)
MRTSVPADGGLNCSVCHRDAAVNSGPGRVRITMGAYVPGARQQIMVTVEDPTAVKFGFQLTARLKSDESKPAGTLLPTGADVAVSCPDQSPAPCAPGAVMFASHSGVAATRPNSSSPRVFLVDWIAPDAEAGDVILYAAANGANNSGTNIGDHIYTTNMTISPMTCNLSGRPSITAITNSAAAGPISSNALISIYGAGFGGENADYVVGRTDRDWPKEFGCVAVEIGGKRAPVFYVRRDQINAQAPILEGMGNLQARVILNPGTPNEIRSDATQAQVVARAPALFTVDGHMAAAHRPDGTLVNAQSPAHPGEVIVVYGSGFGFTDPVFQPGEFAFDSPTLSGVSVTLGGRPVTDVSFAGLSSAAPGLYRFDWRVPMDAPDGDAALVLRVGGNNSQTGVTIPVRR